MDMSGEYRIPASREAVFAALNDPDILKQCIPGCQSLDKAEDGSMTATVIAKIGPVKATFNGKVTLSDIVEPESYTISGEGQGGVAGFAKGGAEVALEEDDAGTLLKYTAKAQVGGKLAQLGSRLVDATARKMADDFFSAFAERLGGGAVPEEGEDHVLTDAEEAERDPETMAEALETAVEVEAGRSGGGFAWGWIALAALALGLLVFSVV